MVALPHSLPEDEECYPVFWDAYDCSLGLYIYNRVTEKLFIDKNIFNKYKSNVPISAWEKEKASKCGRQKVIPVKSGTRFSFKPQ